MKILEMNLKKGFAKVIPETLDDFWHLYNVIYRNDKVYAGTTREVKVDAKYGRPKRGERIPVFLGVNVEDVGWDKLMGRLRVHGTICDAPEKVPTGAHHTLRASPGMSNTATSGANTVEKLHIRQPAEIVIGSTGVVANTKAMVEAVAERKRKHPEKYDALFEQAEALALIGRKALLAFDLKKVGELMNDNHRLLQQIEVSHEKLDLLVDIAQCLRREIYFDVRTTKRNRLTDWSKTWA